PPTTPRSRLLNEPVANLAGRDRSRTDILHEYFLPADGLESFLEACRAAIPRSRQDLLNVTLRFVAEDRTSVLAYARGPRVAAVMLFSQKVTRGDDEDMAVLTRRLIDPGLTDAQARTFGLFSLDIFDDALHAASGVWAALAAWRSTRATLFYFRVFGTLYCLDGLLGLATGSGYLDLGIFLHGMLDLPFV